MDTNISGKKVAMLATDGFEQAELFDPKKALEQAGARVDILSIPREPKEGTSSPTALGEIKGWDMTDWGKSIHVDRAVTEAKPEQYDALVLPGGVMNPDKLRQNQSAVSFVKAFVESGKPVAAICHGPWTLIEAGVVKDKTLTSWPSLQTDLKNAGAKWVDEQVHVDGNLITSRKPDDIPAFSGAIIAMIRTYASQHTDSGDPAKKAQEQQKQDTKIGQQEKKQANAQTTQPRKQNADEANQPQAQQVSAADREAAEKDSTKAA